MNLVNMKLPKKSEKELKTSCEPCGIGGQDRWPYGLQISFDKEQVSKLKTLGTLKVGDKVNVEATGTVTSIRISERQDSGKDHRVEIQLEEVGVEADAKQKQKKEVEELIK